ncbi:hypothetical protein [Alishewanella phage vB_AspM_Slickus01]|nr:hypothetical protein [Alishewanella phage vB_AspM_Slickus01]
MDSKIKQFVEKINDIRGIQVVECAIVQNNANREEYALTCIKNNQFVTHCFIWKNPNGEYGWSDQQEMQRR